MASRLRLLSAGMVLPLLIALWLLAGAGHAQVEDGAGVGSTAGATPDGPVAPAGVRTEVGGITEVPPGSLPGSDSVTALASEECHRQKVSMGYTDSADKIYLKFTGIKFWCYDGQKVTRGGMNVEPWIRSDSRYGPDQDGYRYVASGLESSDQFLTWNGRPDGAHESVRVGRFEYRAHGFPRAAQVLNPYVSRTGRYNGACDGPKPRDASPRVTAVKPAGGAKGVSPLANVEAVFSKEMSAETIDRGTFQLVKKGDFDPVRASITYDATEKKAIIDPVSGLSAGTYTATVYSGPFGALTAEQDPLIANKVWTFTVAG